MKLTSVLRSLSLGRLVLPALLCLAGPARAADATQPRNQPTNEIVIPKSVFVGNDPRGKDPFFPNRPRFGVSTTTFTNVVSTSGPSLSDLQLRGITGPPERRIALINNFPLVKGEEADVRVSSGKVKVRVLEIREKSVLLLIDGQAEPKELILIDRRLDFTPDP